MSDLAPQTRLQAWYASIPPSDQPSFYLLPYKGVTSLGDSLVPLLSPHYSDEEITCLFIPETYPTPLLPVLPPPTRNTTKPLFLPDFDIADPPLLANSAPPPGPTKPHHSRKTKDLVILPDSPPAGSLATELLADAVHQATSKECNTEQLEEFIRNHTNPTGRGRHASAQEKKSAQASTGKPPFPTPLSLVSSPLSLAVDTLHLRKTSDGLAIWPPPCGAADAPQVPNAVSSSYSFVCFPR